MKLNNKIPRILLVENDRRTRESYEALLRYWGYFPILALGEGTSLIKNAATKASKFHCTLALIDLRLFDDFDPDDTSGLKLIEDLRPIRSIIISGLPDQKIFRDIHEKHKNVPLLSKADSPEKIKQTLDTEIEKSRKAQFADRLD